MVRADGTKSAKIIQVIETRAKKGIGTSSDPVREVIQYWDLEGNPLATFDAAMAPSELQLELKMVKKAISELKEKLQPWNMSVKDQ